MTFIANSIKYTQQRRQFMTKLDKIKKEFKDKVLSSNINDIKKLEIEYLGGNGIIISLIQELKDDPEEKRKVSGREINNLKSYIEKEIKSKINELEKRGKHENLEKEKVNVAIPKLKASTDAQHILTQTIKEVKEFMPTQVPVDHEIALKQELKRKYQFITTISDDRGEEVKYAGIPLSKLIENKNGIGDIIGLLWLKKKLPKYASKFIELIIETVADHGPCVSGAHNAIVAARAGKDLVSSVASGLLTIGPRFGGAIDEAGHYFKWGKDSGLSPEGFVNEMKKKGILIPGIGHKIKNSRNPDKRVILLINYAEKNFPKTEYLDYVRKVEQITTSKKDNLILNVDGCAGVLLVDMLKSLGFTDEEITERLNAGLLNAFFVLGRTIGIIGHVIDQKLLKSSLYRTPYEDVLYDLPDKSEL